MQLHIITRRPCTGARIKLKAIQSQLASRGINAPIIVGVRMTTPFFLNLLVQQAASGVQCFLADDCTAFQIKAVQELAARGIHSGLPSDFEVHLVRQA